MFSWWFGPHRGPLPSVKHHSKTHINKTTVMKQSKGFNGDLKPEHKKTTNWTTMSPTTNIGSQGLLSCNLKVQAQWWSNPYFLLDSLKITRKCHNHQAQPSRGTERSIDEERTNNHKPNITYETNQELQYSNLWTVSRKTARGGGEGLKPVLIAQNLTVFDLSPNYKKSWSV